MTAEVIKIIYGVVLIISMLVASWIVVVTWRWRRVPGAKPLMVQMIGEGWWTLSYALFLFSFPHPTTDPFFWSKITFLGVVMVPAGFLVWTAHYTNQDGWVNKYTIALMCMEPILCNIFVWVFPRLFFGDFLTTGKLGMAFNLHMLYSYTLMLIGAVMLVLHWLQMPPSYKKQAFLVIVGLILSTLANVLTIILLPTLRLDFSPLGFVIAGMTFTYAQLRHRLFDIMPVARHAVVEGMRDGMMVLDGDDRIIDMNPAAQKMLGGAIHSTLGERAASALPVWADMERQFANQTDADIEVPVEQNEKRLINITQTIMFDKRNQPGGKLVILRDVTAHKQAQEALRESREKYRTIIEQMEDGYFETDLHGNFTFVNEAEARNIGYTQEEMIGMNRHQYADEKNAQALYRLFSEVYKTGKPVKSYDLELIRKDGTRVYHAISAALIRDVDGKVTGFRGIARDITERKLSEEKIK